jgi:hypothetical protein
MWRHRFPPTKDGRQQDLRLGPYPRLSLKAARQKRDEQKLLLQELGNDPCKAKKLTRSEQWSRAAGPTFKEVAEDWHSTKTAGTWSERHSDDVAKKLARDILPALGGRPIEAITTQDCLAVLRAIEQRGWNETAKRTLGVISLVMDYAVALGHCPHNPAHALKRHAPVKQINSHFPCIGWGELAELLGAMRANTIHADASTLHAMWLLALPVDGAGRADEGPPWQSAGKSGAPLSPGGQDPREPVGPDGPPGLCVQERAHGFGPHQQQHREHGAQAHGL